MSRSVPELRRARMQPVTQNVHINHSSTIWQPRTRSQRLAGHARTYTRAHAPAPPRAAAAAAAAVSATHRPDVAVRSRPQLARFVLLRIHPPPYIHHPHPPAAITHRRANETTRMAEQSGARPHRSSCKTCFLCGSSVLARAPRRAPCLSRAPPVSRVTSPCGYGLFS